MISKVHFVTSTTYKREAKLDSAWSKEFLRVTIQYYKYIFNYKIYGYVILPIGFILLIDPQVNTDMPQIMKNIKGSYAREYNRMFKKQGCVWQQSYNDRVIEQMSEVAQKLEVIHYSPVRLGFVENSSDYVYSSFKHYMGKKDELVDEIGI